MDIERTFGPKLQRIAGQFDAQNSRHIFRRHIGNPQWQEWSLTVGDIANNLRASLDHIAYQFRLEAVKDLRELERITFPILQQPNSGTFSFLAKVLEPNAFKQIEKSQPYNTLGRWPEIVLSPLWVINELARIDKHRSLNIIPLMTAIEPLKIPGHGILRVSLDNTYLVATVSGDVNPQDKLEPEFSIEPGIELTIENTIYHYNFGYLHDAYNIIRNEIIPTFESILPSR